MVDVLSYSDCPTGMAHLMPPPAPPILPSPHAKLQTPAVKTVVSLQIEKSAKGRVGVGLQASKDSLIISSIAPSSIGMKAGFEVGDVLLSIDGFDAKDRMTKHKANALLFDAKGACHVSVMRLRPLATPGGGETAQQHKMIGSEVTSAPKPNSPSSSQRKKRKHDEPDPSQTITKSKGEEEPGSPSLADLLSDMEDACKDLAAHANASTADAIDAVAAPNMNRVAGIKSRLAALADKVGTRSFKPQESVTYKHPRTGQFHEAIVVEVYESSSMEYRIVSGMHSFRAQAHELRAREAEAQSSEMDGDENEALREPAAPKAAALGHRPRPEAVPVLDLTARGIGGNAIPMKKNAKNFGW